MYASNFMFNSLCDKFGKRLRNAPRSPARANSLASAMASHRCAGVRRAINSNCCQSTGSSSSAKEVFVSILTKPILHALPRTRIMPRQCVAATRDDACTAFQTAVVFDVNQAVVAERVNARRTDERAILGGALGFAHVMIYRDMALVVNLVSVEAKLWFYVDGHGTLFYLRVRLTFSEESIRTIVLPINSSASGQTALCTPKFL